MESVILQLRWLYVQVFECFRLRINDLVEEFPLNLIRGGCLPPERAVESLCYWFHYGSWNVNVATLFKDFSVYELGDLCHRVIRRSI